MSGLLPVLPALLALLGCGPAVPERPNILLLTLDTTRADHLQSYGYFRQTTPHLDALAERSIFFEDHVVPMATTLPTHTSILTGTWPLEHGVLANVKHGGERFVASPSLRSFAAYLQDQGYHTGAFVSATPVKRGTGIESGFEVFDEPRAKDRGAWHTSKAARRWLNGRDDRPFFAWVHYFDPHSPFEPPEEWAERWTDEPPLRDWLDGRGFSTAARPNGHTVDPVADTNLYDGELGLMDEAIGALLKRGEAQGWLEDTLIVVVGDHGEGLGQHGMAGHGGVWLEQLRAPFFIVSPWHRPRRVARTVSAPDVLPTVLGLVDLPGEEAWLAQVSGVDALAPGAPERPVYSQSSMRQLALGADVWSLTAGDWRYVRLGDEGERLFHRPSDPHELVDLSAAHPLVLARMRRWAEEERAAQAARGEQLGRAAPRPVDEATVEELRELGYVE